MSESENTVPESRETVGQMLDVEPTAELPSFRTRILNILRSAKEDYQDGDSRSLKLLSGLGVIAMQGLDRARASVVFVPVVAVDVLKDTHSPAQAALAAGATFAGWCAAVGATTTEALNQYPRAVAEFENSFPAVSDVFEDSLPGFNRDSEGGGLSRRLGHSAITHLKRGFTVSGIGTTAYVSMAAITGRRRSDTHRLNLNASIDGGAAIGGVVFGVGEAIVKLADTDPQLALRIQDDASNIYLWYGVAGLMLVHQFVSSRIKKSRQKPKLENNGETNQITDDFDIRLIDKANAEELQRAAKLEQKRWDEKSYGSLEDYKKYKQQSRVFAAFDVNGECVGVTRLFDGFPELPPFIEEMSIDDPQLKADLLEGCRDGTVEELGVAAIDKNAPLIKINTELWRKAWRDADARGIKAWGIIMEPNRVRIMRKRYGFPFEQVGPTVDYQGGDCAAHVMNFADVHTYMREQRPEYYQWFVKEAI